MTDSIPEGTSLDEIDAALMAYLEEEGVVAYIAAGIRSKVVACAVQLRANIGLPVREGARLLALHVLDGHPSIASVSAEAWRIVGRHRNETD